MKIISQTLLLVLLLTGGYFGWQYKDHLPFLGASEEKAASGKRRRGGRAPLVITASVQLQDLRQTVTAVGTLQAKDSIDVTAKVTAKILKIHFSEGAVAQKGETLVTLDSTEPRAQLAESRAELINSRKLYERTLKLYKSGNSPKARVDLLLSEMQIAEAKVAAGNARLNDFVIKAPFSGRLGFKDASVGALVRPGDRITTLDNIAQLQLDFDLPESHLANVKNDQSFQAVSVAYPEKQFNGAVQTISTRIDPVTRSVRIRGLLQNPDDLLKPGMFLSVQLQTGFVKNAIMVPEEAIVISAAGHFVYVVEGDVSFRREVKIGERTRGWAQITEGVTKDDIVVTEGLQKVRDGQKIKQKSDTSPTAKNRTKEQAQ